MAWLTINDMCNLLEQFNLNSPSAAFEVVSGMEGWQTADPDPGPTHVVTHVVTNHHRADVLVEVMPLHVPHRWLWLFEFMMWIVTSAPVSNAH